ncbi:low temperature requirement protein A [Nonomuraea polychroma]|uniref:low temperature requirement protein A n=1 Tax=Nonomuraea polychroma TaxID=46176 RepID=UPI003D919F87
MARLTVPRWRAADRAPAGRVTTVEVFFDVVFVFTLTQLTHILEADLSLTGFGRVLLLFAILWWMFDGYVWLPNHVPPRLPAQKLLLFVAMAGFLIAAVGMPRAFAGTGVVFGIGYLVVIIVHLILFTQADVGKGLRRLAPYNLAAALLVLAGGFAGGAAQYVCWVAAFALQMVVPYLVPRRSWVSVVWSFRIAPEHFVERHGLLVIIALGESVVVIGMGVDVAHLSAGMLAMVVLALALPGALWWTYFTDTPAAEAVLRAAEPGSRARLALRLGFAHIPALLGVMVAAAGVHGAVAHPGSPASWQSALALAGGVVMFLAGIVWVRRSLHTLPIGGRLVTAAAVLATMPIGTAVNAGLQLTAVVAVLVAMLVVDRRHHAQATAAEAAG